MRRPCPILGTHLPIHSSVSTCVGEGSCCSRPPPITPIECIEGVVRHVTIALALSALLAGCERNEPVAGGQPLSHWAREARQYSIMSFWNSSRDERRHVAFEKLLEIGEPAVPTLLELLGSDNPSISGDAFNALCQLGPRARSAVPELVRMLKSPC